MSQNPKIFQNARVLPLKMKRAPKRAFLLYPLVKRPFLLYPLIKRRKTGKSHVPFPHKNVRTASFLVVLGSTLGSILDPSGHHFRYLFIIERDRTLVKRIGRNAINSVRLLFYWRKGHDFGPDFGPVQVVLAKSTREAGLWTQRESSNPPKK